MTSKDGHCMGNFIVFFFSSGRRHTRYWRDWSSDVFSSDLPLTERTGEHGAPLRRSAAADAAGLLADLVERGARTLAFVRSRRSAESVAEQARRLLHERGRSDLVRRVGSYRGGYQIGRAACRGREETSEGA